MWNEPNLGQFWNGTRSQFIELFKVGADAAHAADPDCFVIGPEISDAGPRTTWMTELLQQAGNKIDIISFHQYGGSDYPAGRAAEMDSMYYTILNLGYGKKPIWLTESGFTSDHIGEQTQATYVTEMLAEMRTRPWWKKFFWYQIWEGSTDQFGLLNQDQTRKPAWYAYRDYTAANPAPETVSVNLSTNDIVDGISLVTVGDGHTVPVTTASRASRRNTNAAGGDYYMYFNVDDEFAFEGDRPVVAVTVDYYDFGSGTLTLQYDSIGGNFNDRYKNGGSFTLGNKDTWKQHTFYLTDAYFGNRQNNGADFRIFGGVGTTFYLDLVQVSAAVVPESGDYNGDGLVNAADYVLWRKNPTGVYTQNEFDLWRGDFGETVGSSAQSYLNAPEPSLAALIGLAVTGWCFAGRSVSKSMPKRLCVR
jgi:hypothetical protein